MKNSTNNGYDQHYNVQVAVTQDSLLIVATSLSNHPNDKCEAEPTLDALSSKLGQPKGAALDNGFYSEHNIQAFRTTPDRTVHRHRARGALHGRG